jgi:NAD(P)-dependent dehydrogenase (short-subunit alcohol dehydrogenase family)
MQLDLSGQHALVTGGASGIGATVARRFAALGAHVIVTDLNDVDGAAIAAEIGGEYHHLDVSSAREWDALIAPHGALDIAFLNAGVSTRLPDAEPSDAPLSEVTDAAYRRIMGANVDGVVFGARAVLPKMIERGRGHIVMTASMAGLGAVPFDPIYALTKHAVVGFAKSLGLVAGPHGVCTSAICPGFADTNIVSAETKQMLGLAGVPVISPERVADTVITAIEAHQPGSVWAVWGDLPITRYEPTPPFHGMIPTP